MADKPNTYIRLYFSNLTQLEMLSYEQVGRMIVDIMRNKARGEPLDFSDDEILSLVAEGLIARIDEDFDSYMRKCATNRENGSKGGAPKGNQNARKTTETTDRLKTTLNKKENNKTHKKDIYSRADSTKYSSEVAEVVAYLNDRAGTNYKPTTKNTVKHIAARLNEGYTVAEIRRVIESKCAEWRGTEYARYLRPDTLFGSKFESYLNAASAESKNAEGGISQFLSDAPQEVTP